MPKIRTIGQLQAALTEDLKWRTQEVSQWEAVTARAKRHELSAVVRGGVALLYGHWEGYVKSAVTCYLEYVSLKGLPIADLRDELAAIALRGLLGKGEASKKALDHTAVVSAIRETREDLPIKLPYDQATVRTYSNLNFERFEDIMHSIGCDSSRHDIHRGLIDLRLLKARNEIAHGREFYVELEDWKVLRKRVFEILADVRSQIGNSAENEEYRHSSPSRTSK
ncbi:MAE_28990/MAE_18760 family HEPN-like nuclease [Actinokineospora globicatena]|uniref:MAE-28990/MAE-18760-like HEPN domain-containing protein n=1 Tax=Actinokineospora globicatena TaxID=103729 RepID=A0A9W6V8N4_9PSEU|nr:MAE_28990/MAE_18760 family HEPN-like nuclease [Actinokineospora globicatena]GLW91144.1 hypothetical protein Aglo03_19600 [Actinokineospora globicatena]